MNKILITGASGFIGSHLVEYLVNDGEKPSHLRLLIPKNESLDNLPKKDFDIVRGDVRDRKMVDLAMKGVDIVYHLAAKTVVDQGTYKFYKDVNVLGTENMVKSARKNGVKKFIFFSSISVFGLPAWKGDMINISENSPKEPSEPYGRTKLEAEKLLIKYTKRSRMKYIIIRPTTVYGPRDKAGIAQLFTAIKNNVFFFIGTAQNKMDYIYVRDLVRAARNAQKKNIENEDFIVGSIQPTTQQYIVSCISQSLGKHTPRIHIPKQFALFVSYIVKGISDMLGIRPLLFPARVRVLTSNCYFDSSKAAKLLGHSIKTSIKEGMKITKESI